MKTDKVLDGLFGLCVGDALGVPVEFISRERLKEHPVTDMIGFGTHNQPKGTWSDDSSLTFCLAESLCLGYDLKDLAERFCNWLFEGYWTPHGYVFDVGSTTRHAISRLKLGVNPVEAGGTDEYDNGNGSLMRILPLAFYLERTEDKKKFEIIHQVSSLTHGHIRSHIACGIYIQFAINIITGDTLKSAYESTKSKIIKCYMEEPYRSELNNFSRILQSDISGLSEDEIISGGYVVNTLEACLWCLLNNNSYVDTVLCAVNLGGDTDTTGAVVGGLAGIYYGYKSILRDWTDQIARKEDVKKLADRLNKKIYG